MRHKRSFCGMLLASALCAGPAIADGPQPPASTLAVVRDMRLSILARRALAGDPDLSKLHLAVAVNNGVATLKGEVPSAELGERAVARVQGVEGIEMVRDETIGGRAKREPVPTLSIPPSVPQRVVFETVKKESEPAVRKTREKAVVVANDGKGKRKPPTQPGPLLLPTPPEHGVVVPNSPPTRASSTPAANAALAGPLGAAVAKVKASRRRFEEVPVRVRGDVIYINPSDANEDDVTALRDALRRLAGVREVVMTR